ncbi:hypothetical protein SISNIDRAFT_277693 [Sistotremastrum niveocremeum HHB9708]|nr:hypothetical protein SISNIDRAFT_277693 [Sistotremastrum niveocremeum HHB9708]
MPAEQLVTGPPPEISLGLSVQEFSLNDTSHHHQVPVGTIYPPPIISIEASIEGEDPETLLRHTMTRHDIEQPPQETNQKKSLYGSSATHTFNNTLPEIHAAEPNNEISIFFPQSVAVGFADYFAGSNGLGVSSSP